MQLGTVIGHATSTIKHASLNGWRLVIVQPLNVRREPEADPVVAVDKFNAGQGARAYVGNDKSPVRWFVIGIEDPT
jgi:ethanolamine utilization protein EutN